ncbi:MAG: ABC transporter permease [Acidimicrobiia bacterium]|nr:ABC transporter permease [Acidimicrobiia bacterium]
MKAVAIAAANLRRFARDRSNIFFVFVLPIGIVLLIGAQFGGDFSPKVGVVASGTDIGATIRAGLDSEEDVSIVDYADEAELLVAIERGGVSAGVVLPAAADDAIAAGGTVEVGFIARPDGLGPQLEAVVAEVVASSAQEVDAARFVAGLGVDEVAAADAASIAIAQVPDIDVTVVTAGDSLFPSSLGQFDIGASTQLVLFMFLTGLAGSAAIIQTRKLGVATRMLGTPTSVGTIVAGEALGRFAIVLAQGIYILLATVLLFQVNWGNPLGVAIVMLAFAAVGAGAALLMGTVFANDQQAGGIGVVAGIGLAAIGGSMLPLELFGDTMRQIANFTPHAWANEAFADLVRREGTVADVMPEVGVLIAFAVGFLLLATWRMRRVLTAR